MAACAAPACRTITAAARMKQLRRAIFIWLLPNAFAQLLYCRILAAPRKARLWQVGRFECNGLHLPQPEGLKTLLRPPPLAHSALQAASDASRVEGSEDRSIANWSHGTIRPERRNRSPCLPARCPGWSRTCSPDTLRLTVPLKPFTPLTLTFGYPTLPLPRSPKS